MNDPVYRPPRAFVKMLAVAITACVIALPAAAQYGVPQSIAGNGGAEITGANFGVRSTVGQPVIGRTARADAVHLAGYWYNPGTTVTGVSDDADGLPAFHELFQNTPNPFNPSTTIRFALPVQSRVRLTVFDVLGRRVALLVDRVVAPGYHTELLDATGLASGVYFYRLEAGAFVQTRKLVVLK